MRIMTKHYPVEQRERALKMVLDHLDEYRSVYAACQATGPKVGVGAESLRRWTLRAHLDDNQRPGVTSVDQQRIKDLEREVRDRKEANEILKRERRSASFSSYFISTVQSCSSPTQLRPSRPRVQRILTSCGLESCNRIAGQTCNSQWRTEVSADDSRQPTAQQQREVLKSHAVWACNLWSREPVHVNMIDVLAGMVSQHQATFCARVET
jgi:transposase-like protein